MKSCILCGRRANRQGKFCSVKCQVESESLKVLNLVDEPLDKIFALVDGSEAWKPDALDPVEEIHANRVGVISDVHCPLHSGKWLKRAILTFRHYGVDTVVINGDFLDANQISRHAGSYYRRNANLEHDFLAGEAVLGILCGLYKKVYYLMGNHDMRLIHRMGGEISVNRAFQMLGSYRNLKITSRSFVIANSNVLIGHPIQYSRIRGNVAQKVAMRWQKHTILGHQHHSAKSMSPCGKWQAADVGCLADTEIQDFVRNSVNDMPDPVNGFSVIDNQYIQLFDKHTPWKMYGLPPME